MSATDKGNTRNGAEDQTAPKRQGPSPKDSPQVLEFVEKMVKTVSVGKALKEGISVSTVAEDYGLDESEVQARKDRMDADEQELKEREKEGSPSYDGVSAILERSALSLPQVIAITLLTCGATMTDAAKAAGVRRETVHRWVREQYEFSAVLAEMRSNLIQLSVAHLVSALEPATRNIVEAIRGGDLAVSLQLVKGIGVLGAPSPGWRQVDKRRRVNLRGLDSEDRNRQP